MKQIFYLLSAMVLLLSSCTKDEIISQNQDGQQALGFSIVSDKLSKATEVTTATLGEFKVYGYYYTTTPNYSTDIKYFDNQLVTYSSSKWTYSPVKYWPASGKLDFYAYKPFDNLVVGPGVNTKVPVSYTVANLAADQKDVVIAKALAQVKTGTPASKVQLKFQHALSQVKFYARSQVENVSFNITAIEITNVKNSGSTDMGSVWTVPTTVSSTGNGLVWDVTSGTLTNYSAALANNEGIPYNTGTGLSKYTNVTAATGALMLIPQQLVSGTTSGVITPESGKTYIKLTYQAFYKDTTIPLTNSITYYFALSTTLKPGVRYNYCIGFNDPTKFGIEPIEFDASVEDWVDDSSEIII